MTSESVGPLSRPFALHRVTPSGTGARVEATAEERAALAADLGLPAIHGLEGRYVVSGSAERVTVKGRVTAAIEQICIVSLEPFAARVDEDVEVTFAAPDARATLPAELELPTEHDLPEELVGERIDLGAITAEFLALGLDPYPRRPGIAFEAPAEETGSSPFAALAALRRDGEPG